MGLEQWERETVFAFDESSKKAQITTFSRSVISKLDKFCQEYPDVYKFKNEIIIDGESMGKEYECGNKRLINFRAPTKRKMTEEEKKNAADRLKVNKTKDKKK